MQKITTITLIVYMLFYVFLPFSFAQSLPFSPHYLVSDSEFFNGSSMDETEIQRFLESKNSFLGRWVDPLTQMRPARIIQMVADQYDVSPKAILVTLQKEQSLVENGTSTPSEDALSWAMGYGICDSCSKSDPALQDFKGFFNQVKYGVAVLNKYVREINSQGQTRNGFAPGKVSVVDGTQVIPANIATSVLYTYTPHLQGNQNFYTIWNRWFSLFYPDGTLLQAKGSPVVYLIQQGERRPFKSKSALTTRGYRLDRIIQVDEKVLESYPQGREIRFPQYALFRSPQGTVYLIVDDMKRGFSSYEVFRQLGFNPEEVDDVSQEELDTIPEGKPLTMQDTYPTGALLQNRDTGSVYYVVNGVRRPIIDKQIMTLNFGEKPQLIQADSLTLKSYVIGPPLTLRDGELIMSDNGDSAVYIISNGIRRPIVSAQAFEDLGYAWDDIVVVKESVLSIHPLGEAIKTIN